MPLNYSVAKCRAVYRVSITILRRGTGQGNSSSIALFYLRNSYPQLYCMTERSPRCWAGSYTADQATTRPHIPGSQTQMWVASPSPGCKREQHAWAVTPTVATQVPHEARKSAHCSQRVHFNSFKFFRTLYLTVPYGPSW